MENPIDMIFLTQLPTLNKYINAERSMWQVAAKLKKDTEKELLEELRLYSGIELPREPLAFHFHWKRGNMRSDPDNISFGQKMVFDALVTSGILGGDSCKFVREIHHTFEYAVGGYDALHLKIC